MSFFPLIISYRKIALIRVDGISIATMVGIPSLKYIRAFYEQIRFNFREVFLRDFDKISIYFSTFITL